MERRNSWGSSVRSGSVSPMNTNHQNQMIDDVESERVSEAGDIGDRALHSRKSSESSNLGLSIGHISENGLVLSFPVEQRLQPYQKPLAYYFRSPSSFGNGIVGSEDGEFYFTPCAPLKEEPDKELPVILDYVSCLIHLAVFGILGVLTRYLFQKLFGPGVAGVTSDNTILYLDLPSNMVGSFLMGWFGVVFKGDISNVSEHLAIGITTGYLGSLTTFSGWNQKMLDLSVQGHWLFSALGFLIGLFLVANSIIFGVETAKGFRWLLSKLKLNYSSATNWKVDSYKRQLAVMAAFLVVLGFLWGVSGVLLQHEFKDGGVAAELWFGCLVAPLGVWIRWFLARLNGHGLGRRGLFKWIPFGTLIANLSAACIMAALATMKYSVNNRNCDTIAKGIQFGLLGCLSTVSTFVAEFNAMRESMQPWRAYAYAMITICFSFCFGIVIYCIPIWTVEHHKW